MPMLLGIGTGSENQWPVSCARSSLSPAGTRSSAGKVTGALGFRRKWKGHSEAQFSQREVASHRCLSRTLWMDNVEMYTVVQEDFASREGLLLQGPEVSSGVFVLLVC